MTGPPCPQALPSLCTRESLLEVSAEDRPASPHVSAQRDHGQAAAPPVCLRQTPRQATSAAAYVGAPPEDDDPLLAFAPYLHARPRRNSITPDLQRRFVAVLAATGIVVQAARAIGKSMEALYKLRARPGAEGFAAAWDEAAGWGLLRLEDCAIEAALRANDDAANSMLAFVLSRRDAAGWKVDIRDLAPGHPVYEQIRAEVLSEAARHADLNRC